MKRIEDAILIVLTTVVITLIIFAISGCTYTRNAPLFSNQIEINDSANGNTVTPIP